MVIRRTFPSKNEEVYSQHFIHMNSHLPRNRWFRIKYRRFIKNFVGFLLKCIHVCTTIPYKCWKSIVQPDDKNRYNCEHGSVKYYIYCGISGMVSCAITHTAAVPLDLIKCRLQVKPQIYENLIQGFYVTIQEEGIFGLTKGWTSTFIGYSLQGFGKFAFYEIFKSFYGEILSEENSHTDPTIIYLLASASAELLADVALAPWEAIKIRIQTQDNWATTLRQGLPKFYAEEGIWGFYKGIVPLWLRQIPYTMMKFACYERTVELLNKYLSRKSLEQRTKTEELGIRFLAGYIAGIFCAIVSHPADTIVSKLNNEKGLSLFDAVRRVGFAGLWKGLGPRIFIIGTLTAMQLFFYNTVRIILRVPLT